MSSRLKMASVMKVNSMWFSDCNPQNALKCIPEMKEHFWEKNSQLRSIRSKASSFFLPLPHVSSLSANKTSKNNSEISESSRCLTTELSGNHQLHIILADLIMVFYGRHAVQGHQQHYLQEQTSNPALHLIYLTAARASFFIFKMKQK